MPNPSTSATKPGAESPPPATTLVWKMVLLYMALGCVWQFGSNWVLPRFATKHTFAPGLDAVADSVFMVVTAVLFGVVLDRHLKTVRDTNQRLRESELQLRLALEAAGMVTWELDPAKGTIRYSRNLQEMSGAKDITPYMSLQTFMEQVHPEDRERLVEVTQLTIRDSTPFEAEYRVRIGDGSWRWLLGKGSCIHTDEGTRLVLGVSQDVTERKLAAESLALERQRLASIIEGSHVGTWEWNVQTGETRFNERWAEILGYSLADLAPISLETWTRLAHPDDLKVSEALLQRHFNGELEYYDCEARMKHRDGGWVWILDRGRVTSRTTDGKPLWMQGVHTDITERKRRETYRAMVRNVLLVLAESGTYAESLNRVLGVVKEATGVHAVAIRMKDGDDFPYFCSDGFDRDFLRKENSLLCHREGGALARGPDGRPALECTCGLVLSGRTDPANRLFTPGGSAWTNDAQQLLHEPAGPDPRINPRNECIHRGYASVALIPIHAKGEIIGLLQLNDYRKGQFSLESMEALEDAARNIGEALLRNRAELQLRDSQERLRHLVGAAHDAIIMTDPEGRVTLWNRAARKVFGHDEPDVLGEHLRQLIAPRHSAGVAQENDATPGDELEAEGVRELRAVRGDGTEFPLELSTSRVQLGARPHWVVIARDLTDRNRLQAEKQLIDARLRQQQKLESLGTLAGGVAHEINNPINGIMNYAQLIQDSLGPSSPLLAYSREILKETDRVAAIVRNLLTFARKDKAHQNKARVEDILEGTLSLIRTVMRHDHITLTVDLPQNLPPVDCRTQQIQQVLMNLMTNARDALNERYPSQDPDKLLLLSARAFEKDGRPWVRLTVEDHGSGITPEVRERMFDPFFTTKGRDKGTGLGLSISHGIVREHNGEIIVETEPGHHTRMHVDLPSVNTDTSA